MENETIINDNNKLKDKDYLSSLSKDELINLIINNNSKNLDDVNDGDEDDDNEKQTPPQQQKQQQQSSENKPEKKKQQKIDIHKKKKVRKNKGANVNFDKCYKRHVAFKISYVGYPFFGYAIQECTDETIEHYLLEAFKKTSLISDVKSSNYFKSGRTDKGVSAFGQVISLYVRSNLTEGEGIISPVDQSGGPISTREKTRLPPSEHTKNNNPEKAKRNNKKIIDEFPYVKMLNGVLPPEIRILAWCPVPFHFNARFSTLSRTYKYFFNPYGLDLQLMKEASKLYLGEHNYINFCKIDLNVKSFYRMILNFEIDQVEGSELCVVTVKGFAFLWHQIRCMMAVLFLIGSKKAPVDIITQLLDTTKTLSKPPYEMASEVPLVLFDCGYDDIEWIYETLSQERTLEAMQGLLNDCLIKTEINSLMRRTLSNTECTTTTPKPARLIYPEDIENKTATTPTTTTTTTTTISSNTNTTTSHIGEKRKLSDGSIELSLLEEEKIHKLKQNKNNL